MVHNRFGRLERWIDLSLTLVEPTIDVIGRIEPQLDRADRAHQVASMPRLGLIGWPVA